MTFDGLVPGVDLTPGGPLRGEYDLLLSCSTGVDLTPGGPLRGEYDLLRSCSTGVDLTPGGLAPPVSML